MLQEPRSVRTQHGCMPGLLAQHTEASCSMKPGGRQHSLLKTTGCSQNGRFLNKSKCPAKQPSGNVATWAQPLQVRPVLWRPLPTTRRNACSTAGPKCLAHDQTHSCSCLTSSCVMQEDWMHNRTSSATLSLCFCPSFQIDSPSPLNSPLPPASPPLAGTPPAWMHTAPMNHRVYSALKRYQLSLSSKMKHAHTVAHRTPENTRHIHTCMCSVQPATNSNMLVGCGAAAADCKQLGYTAPSIYCVSRPCASGRSHITQVRPHHALVRHQCGGACRGG